MTTLVRVKPLEDNKGEGRVYPLTSDLLITYCNVPLSRQAGFIKATLLRQRGDAPEVYYYIDDQGVYHLTREILLYLSPSYFSTFAENVLTVCINNKWSTLPDGFKRIFNPANLQWFAVRGK